MRVMITGGTGFLGYHQVMTLLDAGHDVKLLVRSEKKMRKLFGDRVDDFVVGDISDQDKIDEAMEDCDAVIHIAALVSIDAADDDFVYKTNFNGTKKVIGGAVRNGIETIIYVSSVTAIYDPEAKVLNEYTPPGQARRGYGGSKVASEIYVQGLQDTGAPVHITYPATVIGPDAPALTEAHNGLSVYLNNYVPVFPTGNQYVDARDVAEAHLRLLESDLPAGRYPLGGHFLAWEDHAPLLSEITGRNIKSFSLPRAVMTTAGYVSDWLSKAGYNSILTSESAMYATNWIKMDNSKSIEELGIEFRDLEESMADTIRWMAENEHIEADKAGILLDDD